MKIFQDVFFKDCVVKLGSIYIIFNTRFMKQERLTKAQSITKKIIWEFIITQLQNLSATHGIITVTNTEISNDLSYIDIYVSCLLSPETLCKSLSEHGNEIHRILGKKVWFIKVPKVRFRYDTTGEDSSKIYDTLKALEK